MPHLQSIPSSHMHDKVTNNSKVICNKHDFRISLNFTLRITNVKATKYGHTIE
ncbi:hypothetical protein JHK82_033380 [Glycine max]|nr:hypothetical protein JHK87_033319 [Glycine soja]KAG4980143.1 hypothetical protein JHK85_034101 [Glycine max]KAG4985776.1 hypothetical protein JHK86_033467 [Glycine max]KAG5118960.1 hypothetical protein JHK82_033380 [Glycine max]KAG5139953.1 hypothetical protein JHK84_033721 [Glycine max]